MSEILAKTIITKSKIPNVGYCFNPYIGCTHGCVYCYARFMGRFTGNVGKKWGHYLDWKVNAPELLEKELIKIKKEGGIVLLGSVTDCYLSVENKLQITRKSLEVFLKHQIPISILTKSKLVARDLDLLSQFEYCELGMSISVLDEKVSSALEPLASSPADRISVLKQASNLKLQTYAFLGPLHPDLSDLDLLFQNISPFSRFVMGEIPNLRCGNWGELAKTLKELGVDPDEYKKKASSDEFFLLSKKKLESLCQRSNVEFKGMYRH